MTVSSIALIIVGMFAVTMTSPTGKVSDRAVGDLISKLKQDAVSGGTEFVSLTFTYYHDMLHSDYDVEVTGGKIEKFDIKQSGGISVEKNGEKMVAKIPIEITHFALEHRIKCLLDWGASVPNFYYVNGTTASSVAAVIQLDVASASSGTCTGQVASIEVTSAVPAYALDMSKIGQRLPSFHVCTRATRWEATDRLKKNFNANFSSSMVKFLTSHLTTLLDNFNLC